MTRRRKELPEAPPNLTVREGDVPGECPHQVPTSDLLDSGWPRCADCRHELLSRHERAVLAGRFDPRAAAAGDDR